MQSRSSTEQPAPTLTPCHPSIGSCATSAKLHSDARSLSGRSPNPCTRRFAPWSPRVRARLAGHRCQLRRRICNRCKRSSNCEQREASCLWKPEEVLPLRWRLMRNHGSRAAWDRRVSRSLCPAGRHQGAAHRAQVGAPPPVRSPLSAGRRPPGATCPSRCAGTQTEAVSSAPSLHGSVSGAEILQRLPPTVPRMKHTGSSCNALLQESGG